MQNFIRRTAAALAVLCMAVLLLGTPTGAERRTYPAGGEVVGYYAGWADYQGWTPDQIPAEHLTQINYCLLYTSPSRGGCWGCTKTPPARCPRSAEVRCS